MQSIIYNIDHWSSNFKDCIAVKHSHNNPFEEFGWLQWVWTHTANHFKCTRPLFHCLHRNIKIKLTSSLLIQLQLIVKVLFLFCDIYSKSFSSSLPAVYCQASRNSSCCLIFQLHTWLLNQLLKMHNLRHTAKTLTGKHPCNCNCKLMTFLCNLDV